MKDPGTPTAAKLALYKRIVERLRRNPGVRPEDALISVTATAAEDWSFGHGETQFYAPAEPRGGRALTDTRPPDCA